MHDRFRQETMKMQKYSRLSPFAFYGYFWYLNIFPLHRQFEFHYLIQLCEENI